MRHVYVAILLAACGKVPSSSSVDAAGSADARSPDAIAAPMISALSPTRGIVTTDVTITGTGFGATQGASTITFGGTTATVMTWTDTRIVATVPDVLPGDVDVVVTAAGGAASPSTFSVILPPMAYINNDGNDTSGNDTITAMSFDPTTGVMTTSAASVPVGVPAGSYGGCSQSIVVHAHTRHLFATGATGVASYTIDPVSGALTAVAGSPFAVGSRAFGLIPSADGTKLFVTSYDSKTVSVFTVGADGVLTPVTGSPFATANGVDTITTAADDTLVYANTYESAFQAFSAAADGSLTSLGAPTASTSDAIATRPGQDQLYTTLSTGGIGVWNVDPTTGNTTQITGSPFTVAASSALVDSPLFTSDGGRAYFGINEASEILAYDLATDGTPTAITGTPFDFSATIGEMSCLAISQDDAWIVGADEDDLLVGVFHLDANGVPTQATGSPFATGAPVTGASGLAITF